MADDRTFADPVDQLADLAKQFTDYRSTVLARLTRKATGTIEPTLRTAANQSQYSLVLDGSTHLRTDFPDLWQFAQDNSLAPTMFGNGDGSTTFVLPDARGKLMHGWNGEALGSTIGADSFTMTAANMPGHIHPASMSGPGNHGNHLPGGSGWSIATSPFAGTMVNLSGENGSGVSDHTHSVTISNNSTTNTPVDIRQQSFAVNWIIWI